MRFSARTRKSNDMTPVPRSADRRSVGVEIRRGEILVRGFVLLFLALLPVHAVQAQIAQAKVSGGVVSGVTEGEIASFKGIPFGAPPVGEMRWRAPAAVKPWAGIRKADAFASACMQAPNSQGNTAPVSEDCLYLNVWTPAERPATRFP